MSEYSAFTSFAPRLMRVLRSDVLVSPYVSSNNYTPRLWRGIWDTGASSSSIDQRVVDSLNLVPVGSAKVSTANGFTNAKTYIVNISLPNNVIVNQTLVTAVNLGPDIDVLIGMDIICLGDFAITNLNRETSFSFRIPSVDRIDFVKDYNDSHGIPSDGIR